MGKRKAAWAGRVWKLLTLAMLWAKKGGAFGRGLSPGLRFVPRYLRSLRASPRGSDVVRYAAEKEFSFDETPLFRFKLRRPKSVRTLSIPCINPPVVDFEDDDSFFRRDGRVSWLRQSVDDANREEDEGEEEEEREDAKVLGSAAGEMLSEVGGEEECIDVRAEEFIAQFYEQVRLQRQVSILRYNDMLLRSAG